MSHSKTRKWPKIVIQLLLFIGIVTGGLLSAKHFIDTKPTAKRSRPARQVPLVDIQPIRTTSKTVVVNAMGTVVSSREISLFSELSGTITWVSPDFVPGGKIRKGKVLIRLDRTDYELAVKKQQSLVEQLQADLDLEKGQQEVARKEMELMQKTLKKTIKDPKLVLRVPQLNKALASLKSQQISLEQAKLNLKRTTITAPFNAMILDRNVELGSRISTQSTLATLTDTDVFWIEATLPVEKLRWIKIPGLNGSASSSVTVNLQDGSTAKGRVIQLRGNLGDKSQMARILVQVKDPLATSTRRGKMPLLLNSYVSLNLTGSTISDVVEIPRTAVKDGYQIWMFENRQLKIKSIKPVWEDEHNLYVRNNRLPGGLLITSEMSTAVDGMSVRTLGDKSEDTRIANVRKQSKPGKKKQARGSNMRPQEVK